MRTWLQDLRYAIRGLRLAPGFTLVAAITLALGVGANTAIFSLLDDAALQRLPVAEPERLRTLVVASRAGEVMSNVPAELFQELRRGPTAFSGVVGTWRTEMNVDTGADAERALVQYVSGGYHAMLGVTMFLGRPLVDADESGPLVAVVSHRFWLRHFGGDPQAIGRVVHVNGQPAAIVGVTPPQFFGLDRGISPDVTMPLPSRSPFSNLWVTARLRPGATDADARAEANAGLQRALAIIAPRLARYRESSRQAILTLRADLRPADKGLGIAMQSYVEPLRLLLLLSAGVLLIACVNVANLLMARAVARRHEFGVRLALGAGRWRLVRQVFTESSVLAALGSVLGVTLAVALHRALVGLLMQDLAYRDLAFRLNAHVLAFALAVTATTVLVFGIAPALASTRVDIGASLQSAAPRGRGRRRALARGLVVAQVAAALVLLVGAGLLLRSFRSLSALDTGVGLERMLTLRISLSPRETQRLQKTPVYTELAGRVSAVPGVAASALAWDYALASGGSNKSIWVEGLPPEQGQTAGFNVVGPGFFATAGIPVVLGREFGPSDAAGAPKVVIVNEALVRHYAAGKNPIGLHIGDEGAASIAKYEIVGVVRDSLTMRLRRPAGPVLYQPLLQDEWASNVVLHVRTRDDPLLVSDRVRAAIRSFDPRLPVYDVTTLGERHARALGRDRMMAVLSGGLGTVALLLTVVGIYGVIAYSASRRTAEIGIRIALGATAASVRWLIVRETALLLAIGGAIGLPLSLVASTLLRSMLFGVAPQDPATLAACVGLLALAGCAAGYVPASRAARLEPAAALRRE